MTKRVCVMLIASILMLFGCSTTKVWVSSPEIQQAQNTFFTIHLEPLQSDAGVFNSFRLELTNKSSADLEIDWNNSRYLYNGKDTGVFIFEGIEPSDIKTSSVKPDIVPPGRAFVKTIGPYRLVAKAPTRDDRQDVTAPGFSFGPIPAGRNGINLVVRQDGREFTETLTVTIRETNR